MTWAKYGMEFYDQLADAPLHAALDDAAQLTHAQAIHYLYRTESKDLAFKKRNLFRFASSDKAEQAAAELVRTGLWKDHGDTYEIVHHADVIRQSLAAQQVKRDRDKKRQQDKRSNANRNADRMNHANDVANDVAATQSVSQSDSQAGISKQENNLVDLETGEVFDDEDDDFSAWLREQEHVS